VEVLSKGTTSGELMTSELERLEARAEELSKTITDKQKRIEELETTVQSYFEQNNKLTSEKEGLQTYVVEIRDKLFQMEKQNK
jgi:chromosome segregation ATPase